jgi:integrase
MSIRKTKTGYLVEVYAAGQRIRRTAKSQAEAKKLEGRLRHELESNTLVRRGIEEVLLQYLKTDALRLKSYDTLLSKARLIQPFIRGKSFNDIPSVVQAIKTDGQQLAPATINRRLALLRKICNCAVEWGYINSVPKIKLLSENNERHYYLSVGQVGQLERACPDPQVAFAIRLAAYTGLRRSELLSLTRENIRGNYILLGARTKNGRPRVIPIPKRIQDISSCIPLMVTERSLRVGFERAREEVGMKHIRFHDLRHTYASLLAAKGATLKEIGTLLGHSTPTMTNRYTHLTDEHLQEVVEKLG